MRPAFGTLVAASPSLGAGGGCRGRLGRCTQAERVDEAQQPGTVPRGTRHEPAEAQTFRQALP
jgi:hypothetical protein